MYPTLFETGFFRLETSWFFFIIAVTGFAISLIYQAKKNNLKTQFLLEKTLLITLLAVFFARLIAIIPFFNLYFPELSIQTVSNFFAIWDKNLNIWGAIFGGLLGFYFISKNSKQNFFKWADILVPSILIALAIGSLGDFFSGESYGIETKLPWGVNFESPAIKYTVPIHPTQIYAFVYSLLIASTLITLDLYTKIKEKRSPGFFSFIATFFYSLFRFLEEFIRGDDVMMIGNYRITQIIFLLTTIISGIFIWLIYNRTVDFSDTEQKPKKTIKLNS